MLFPPLFRNACFSRAKLEGVRLKIGKRLQVPVNSNDRKTIITPPLLAFWITSFLCLGITLLVYSTHLNPGLPILLGGLLTIFWSGFRLIKGTGPYYHWGLDILLLLTGWATLSATQTLDVYLSQRSLATLFGGTGFVLGAACAIHTARQWRATAHAFILFITVTCLLAWPAALQTAIETGTIPAVCGTFNNPDPFSVLPLLALCLGCGLLEKTNRLWTTLLLTELGILFVTILGTGCRAAMVGAGVAIIVSFAILLTKRRSELQKTRYLLGFPLIIILALLPLSNFAMHGTDKVTKTLTTDMMASEAVRFEVARHVWKAVLKKPLFGSGPGAFGLSYQAVRPDDHENYYVNIAHNDHIEAAVELGVIGFALWITVWGAALYKTNRGVREGRRPAAAAGALAAILAGFVFALFNFIVVERPAFWAQLFILGLALSLPSRRQSQNEHPLGRWLLTGLLLLLACWATIFGTKSLKAESLAVEAQAAGAELRFEDALLLWTQAVELQPDRTTLRQNRADAAQRLAILNGTEDPSPEALEQLERALESSPASISALVGLAELKIRAREFESAEELLRQADKAAPGSRLINEKRLAIALESGDFLTASKLLRSSRTQSKDKSKALVETLIALELKTPGEGAELMRSWLVTDESINQDLYVTVLLQAQKRGLTQVSQSFLRMKTALDPDDLCSQLALTQLNGLENGPEEIFQRTTELLESPGASESPCYDEELTRWIQLGLELDERSKVHQRLSHVLEKDSNKSWVRIELSKLEQSENQMDKARALLREGLDKNPHDLDLNLALAELYEASGTQNIALNYYREVQKIDPKNRRAAAKIKELLAK